MECAEKQREKQIQQMTKSNFGEVIFMSGKKGAKIIVICFLSIFSGGLLACNSNNFTAFTDGIKLCRMLTEDITAERFSQVEEESEDVLREAVAAPTKEEVLTMRTLVTEGMTEDEIARITENIKVANLALERAYLNENLFEHLSDPDDLYWNYVDEKEDIQIGWALEDIEYDASSGLSYEEYAERYGVPVMAYNRFDADNFIMLMTEMRDSLKTEYLKEDFDQMISYMELAKETHDVEYMKEIYYILHDMDYFLFRYGIEDVGKYTNDSSTVAKYYGALGVYEE